MVKEPAIMRRLDLRSTFRGWANSHKVPGINRDVFCGKFRSLPRSGCTPEPSVTWSRFCLPKTNLFYDCLSSPEGKYRPIRYNARETGKTVLTQWVDQSAAFPAEQ